MLETFFHNAPSSDIILMALQKYYKLRKLKLFISVQNSKAPVKRVTYYTRKSVWERL